MKNLSYFEITQILVSVLYFIACGMDLRLSHISHGLVLSGHCNYYFWVPPMDSFYWNAFVFPSI